MPICCTSWFDGYNVKPLRLPVHDRPSVEALWAAAPWPEDAYRVSFWLVQEGGNLKMLVGGDASANRLRSASFA